MASGASVSELAPPGTKVAAGVNVGALLNSFLAKEMGDEARTMAGMLAAQRNLAGFDPLRDVDRILVLVTDPDASAPALVIVTGRFDVEQLARGAKRYHDVPVLEDAIDAGAAGAANATDGAIGLIDSQTAIVGKLAQVHAAIDRLGSGAQLDADLLSRIDAAWSRYDFWGTGDNPGSPTGTGDTADALRSIDRFSFGLALRQGLELTAEIHPRTSEDGAKLMTALSMIDMALKTRQPKDSGAKFNLDSDHGTLRVSVTVPEQELREAIQAQRASMVAAVSSRVRGAGPQTARARVQPGALNAPATAPEATLPTIERPATLPVLEAMTPPAPSVAAKVMVPVASKLPARIEIVRPETKTQIVTAPNGDTLFVKLPGAR